MPVRALPPALEEKAREELGESPELLESGIRDLKEWIATQPHLRARTDDQWLAAFLRGCKFRLELVKSKFDLYYTLRSTAPDLYPIKYDDEKVNEILELGAVALVPSTTRNPAAPTVTIIRCGTFNPKEHTVFDVMAVFTFMYQIDLMQNDNLTVAGVINIVDLRNSKFAHYTQASPKQLRNFTYAQQDALPTRIKEVHIIGAPYIFEKIMNFLKRFLNEKIKKRLNFHSSIDTLHEYVPKDMLPEEYGGTGPPMSEVIDNWKRKFNEFSEFFEEDLKYGTDESKRVK